MSAARLKRIDDAVRVAIEHKELPGAVVLVARKGKIVLRRAYGMRALEPQREPMTPDTIFDLASLTKVVATTTCAMILIERGQLRLNDPVVKYLPKLKGDGRDQITIEQLLTHVSGFAPDFDLREQWTGTDEALKHLYREKLKGQPGANFVYSDLGMITLGEIIHRASGLTLDEFSRRNIFQPLGMSETGFNPPRTKVKRIAPTETRRSQGNYLGGQASDKDSDEWLRGEVHDPTAARMNGVAGHAGLFSTASDLAIFSQMILNGGHYKGVRILSRLGIATMMRARAVGVEAGARGLGWDIATGFSSNRGDLYPYGSFGHTGFTGTSIWIDPASDSFVIFLSNRVHPDGKGNVSPVRGQIASIVAASFINISPARIQQQEINYAAQLLPSLARSEAQRTSVVRSANPSGVVPVVQSTQVLAGIDVLERENFAALKNLRIGLVTNHTGRDRNGRATIDVLQAASQVKLAALFSPEHGIRGVADENVSDTKDERTGLPIYSLYGATRRPKPEQLQNLDALVFDIQDIGTRFYTYISTLGNVMEAAAAAHLPVFVFDRPNPIGGLEVEGPLADADQLSFTAYHSIPVRHGMTIGELARLFNEERKINCDLRVIKMENWRREQWYDATNLNWINPSPNMRSLTEATLYPGIGLLETTNLSVGRGTDTPFELIGAPWLDGQKLASALNEKNIPGVRFVPTRFTPKASVFQGEECGGLNLLITDRQKFRPVQAGLEIAATLVRLYPDKWQVDNYLRLLANRDTLARLKRGEDVETIEQSWTAQLEKFQAARRRVLLYK